MFRKCFGARKIEYILNKNTTFQQDKARFVNDIFLRAYSRTADEHELNTALEMFGVSTAFRKPPTPSKKQQQQNIEDFLWIVFMSPEFQFIH